MISCNGTEEKFINRSLWLVNHLLPFMPFCSLVFSLLEFLMLVTAQLFSFVVEKLLVFSWFLLGLLDRTRRLSVTMLASLRIAHNLLLIGSYTFLLWLIL